ncbi:SURF1 family protein [Paracidovorax citrulli]|uniref:SURF1 family protein n=1 Tax=Paracidovorax citrulli TaxID=80869 RepID=UPI00363559D5
MQPIIRKRTDGARGFRPDWRFWCITAAAVAAMAATAALGRWQLARAAEKQAWQAMIDARQAMPPVPAAALASLPPVAGPESGSPAMPAAEALVHRPAVLRGRWLAQDTVFLDNRQMQGRPGFFVVTPLRLTSPGAEGAVVLVQRGWVPRDFQDRTRLPAVPAPSEDVEVHGRIAAAPSRLYEPGGPASAAGSEGSSRIRQNLDLAAYRAETGLQRLAPLTVIETGGPEGPLQRDWPAVDAGVARHHGYAFQWFGLCALVAILYVWFQIVRRFIRPGRQPAPPCLTDRVPPIRWA